MIQGVVIRGTTPEHSFDLPYDKQLIKDLRITYGQNNKEIFTKTIQECVVSDKKVSILLTQEETLLFKAEKPLNIEIRIKLADQKVVRTEDPIILRVVDTMNEEVI